MGPEEATVLLESCRTATVARGRKILQFDLKNTEVGDVLKVIMGPTGNLRAPTMRVGHRLVVGFSEEMFKDIFAP